MAEGGTGWINHNGENTMIEPVLINGTLVDPTVPGSMVDYQPPTMTAEESNDANDGYTQRTWLDTEAMHTANQ